MDNPLDMDMKLNSEKQAFSEDGPQQIEVYEPFIQLFVRDIDKIDSQVKSLIGAACDFGVVKSEKIMNAILEKTILVADDDMLGQLLASNVNIFDYLKADDLLKILQRSSINKTVKLKAISCFG